ncbi:hypothetical protein BUALT_Bualt08G0139100 [Buddleja alternifolia]|uniref:Uncharacterized protein n=1 Tax=Buddleja alternifolia TaxID=168488 RepID=A0AAV6X6L4_9LAMI|nr:hypothetical protein BUALT_Bualt08G0139100 [Buddleja alternifolia]
MQDGDIEITDISPDGQLKVLQYIASNCYTRNGRRIPPPETWISLPVSMTVNNTANKFTIVGCDSYGFVFGRRLDRNYTTGCTAMCDSMQDLVEGSCMGLGCCRNDIPRDVWRVEIDLRSYENHTNVWDFNNYKDECTVPGLNNCKHGCVNTVGGFHCPCPKGYHGDGREGCSSGPRGQSLMLKLVAGIAVGVIGLLLALCCLYLELKRRRSNRKKQKFFLQNGSALLQEKLIRRERSPDTVKIFSSSELAEATNNFHGSRIIGQGGFGIVYKGLFPDNNVVAIKKSKRVDPNQIDQFINEVIVLSQINHRNVVRLLGCCLETEVPLLVYEFIDNGTLAINIHNQAKARFLDWSMRLKIAAETAGVLSYLHSAASTPIIHRDVKSDNILLDHNFTAKVSDFGAPRFVPLDKTQLSTMVQGTFGYLDPEYMQTNQLTEKSDVYSFGVVLVELITGRKALSFDRPEDEQNLANFFLSVLKKEQLLQVLNDNIVGEGNIEQITEVAKLAQGCLHVKGGDRPSMKEVVMELEGLRLGGKHSWAHTEQNAEEMESLIGEGFDGLAYGDGNSTIAGYDSLRDHVVLPISGGR